MSKHNSPTVLGPNGKPVSKSDDGLPSMDDKAKGAIGLIAFGYYIWFWIVTHPLKAILLSVGLVSGVATLVMVINFGIAIAVGDGPSPIRPIKSADTGEWGNRAGRATRRATDNFLEERRQPAPAPAAPAE